MHCIATFDTTMMALRFEKICRADGHNVRIVPVPRRLSTSCGFACSYPCESQVKIKGLADERNIDVAGYHILND